jgi:membrane-associated progesterone receptor component
MAMSLTAAQLAAFDGSDPSVPLYIAVRGVIYDVSPGRSFYGPGVCRAAQ